MDTTNKPVAYRWRSDLGYIYDIYDHGGGEPLYTRPSEHDLGIAEAIGFDKGYQAAAAKTPTDEKFDRIFADGKRLGVLETEDRFRKAMNLTDEEIEDCYQLWRSLSGDPVKLYQLFKLKEQEK
jgi:hypothetical protein